MSAFDLTVVSDPGAALAFNSPMWGADLAKLAQYDANLVKPGLLFADRVDLRTFREDMLSLVQRDILKVTGMPMRIIWAYVGLSHRRDPDELSLLGVSPSQLASPEETAAFIEHSGSDAGRSSFEWMDEFVNRHYEGFMVAIRALRTLYGERRELLMSPELAEAANAGLLAVRGWSESGLDDFQMNFVDEGEFFASLAVDITDTISSARQALMFEPGAQLMLTNLANPRGSGVVAPLTNKALDNSAGIAAALMGRLPGLTECPMAEVLDIRSDLADHLPPFRAAILDLASEIQAHSGDKPEVLAQQIDRAWHQQINPALTEIRNQIQRGRYRRHVLEAFSEDKASLGAVASGVVLAAGSLAAGLAALLPAAAAASVPFVKALNATLKDRDAVDEQRLLFLYRVRERLAP